MSFHLHETSVFTGNHAEDKEKPPHTLLGIAHLNVAKINDNITDQFVCPLQA
jgi:hypothetical protein